MDKFYGEIDHLTKRIIRKQFGIFIVCIPNKEDKSFNDAAVLLTAIQNRFSYIIHTGVSRYPFGDMPKIAIKEKDIVKHVESDKENIVNYVEPINIIKIKNSITLIKERINSHNYNSIYIGFTVFNNTADRISNKHWEKTITNLAKHNNLSGFIVGYDNIAFQEPLTADCSHKLVGTIKLLQATNPPNLHLNQRLKYSSQAIEGKNSYTDLLHIYAKTLSNNEINFTVSEPYIFDCPHKIQPAIKQDNINFYYQQHKYFDDFYSSDYHSFSYSPLVLDKAKKLLKEIINKH